MLFFVKVPVLSVHKMSIDPKFWIDLILFTSVFFLANALLPLVKFTFTIIGNILGVIPTATDKANSIASFILPLIIPYIINTDIDITTIYLISKEEIRFIPLSNVVSSFTTSFFTFILPI